MFIFFLLERRYQAVRKKHLNAEPDFCERLSKFYEEKRDRFCAMLKDSRLRVKPAQSTFFQVVDYGDISDVDDLSLAKQWTKEIGVASIPLSVFCETPYTGTRLRLCFAKDDETLAEAAHRLCAL